MHEDRQETKRARMDSTFKRNKTSSSKQSSLPLIVRIMNGNESASLPLFEAHFLQGNVGRQVMMEQGADTNLIPSQIVGAIKKAEPDVTITKSGRPYVYNGVQERYT